MIHSMFGKDALKFQNMFLFEMIEKIACFTKRCNHCRPKVQTCYLHVLLFNQSY